MPEKKVNIFAPFPFENFKDLEKLFGPPPILKGEDEDSYTAIGQAIWDASPPEDFIQATRINDIAYLLWEGSRLRRLKVKLIDASKVEGAKKLLSRLDEKYHGASFWNAWALGDQETVEYVDNLLAMAGLDQDAILAQTVETIVDTLEAIERQSAQFEARRFVSMSNFDEHSENLQRRRESTEASRKQVNKSRPRKTKSKQHLETQSAPQLPLDIKAAE